MANNNWFSSGSTFDPSTFDYNAESDRIKRRRSLIDTVVASGTQAKQGQFIKNGDFIGYAGGETPLSTLARIATAYMGTKASDALDDDQKQLGVNSDAALAYQLNPPSQAAKQPDQTAVPQAGEAVNPQGDGDVVSKPLRPDGPMTRTDLPPLKQAAVKALRGNVGGIDFGTQDGWDAPGVDQNVSQAPPAGGAASALLPTVPVGSAVPPRQTPLQAGSQAAAVPQGLPQQVPQQAFADQLKQLQAISRTGPLGSQLAATQLNQIFGDKNGRYKADPIKNGDGDITGVLRTDTRTGQTEVLDYSNKGTGGVSRSDERAQRLQIDQRDSQRKDDQFYNDTTGKLQEVREAKAQVDTSLGLLDDTLASVSRYNAGGGIVSQVYGSIAKAAGDDQANALDAQLKTIGALNLKSLFGGNPSDAEGRALQSVVGSLQAGKVPTMQQLQTLRDLAARRQATLQGSEEAYATQQRRYAPRDSGDTAGKPSGYKQSVTGPNDILRGRM